MINFNAKWLPLPSSDYPIWDDWVNFQKTGTWFHTLRAFNLVHQLQPEILILKDLGGNWVAGFAFVRASKWGFVYPKRNPLLYFSSPVIHDDYLSRFDEIINSLNRHFTFAVYDFPYLQTSYRQFGHSGSEQFGFWLDIERDPEKQLIKMSASHQKVVRKLLTGKLSTKSTYEMSRDDLELAHLSYQDHNKQSPFSTEIMKRVFMHLLNKEAVVINYEDQNLTLGWRCYIKDKKGHWIDWIAGTRRGITKERFGQHLIFAATRQAAIENVTGIDLTGGNTPGIAEFKEKFGAEKTYGLHVKYSKNKVVEFLIILKEKLV